MVEDIREESGIMLIRREGCHLLDLEKFLQQHPDRKCRHLKTPELIQWDDTTLYVLEVKSSVPRLKEPSEKLKKLAAEENQGLCSRMEEYTRKLYEKFASALVCMGEDGKRAVLRYPEALDCHVDDAAAAKAFRISKTKKILLLVLIPDMPDEYEEVMGQALKGTFINKIRAFFPQSECDLRAINAKSACELKLARPLRQA